MLVQLVISEFAIIRHLEISFRPQLNILSGETGAGKSIIINAVDLILGGRASAELIRDGAHEATVEALFSLPANPSLTGVLSDLGVPFEGELLIKRTISREGRNRITVNGSMATLQMLSRLGHLLISVSGQHEHQRLLRPENHLQILDDFGGLTPSRLSLNDVHGRYYTLKERSDQLLREIEAAEEKQELARFQVAEIERAQIEIGEDRELMEEQTRLRHAASLLQTVRRCYEMLYENEDGVLTGASLCLREMEGASELDRRLEEVRDLLTGAKAELEEAALALRSISGDMVVDPRRLEEVDERLEELNRLKRKYGPSLEDVLSYRANTIGRLEDVDEKRIEVQGLAAEMDSVMADLMLKAKELSKMRARVAKKLEKSVEQELRVLDMGGTRFEVRFSASGSGISLNAGTTMQSHKPDGLDEVEFMLSPNVGEDMRPLAKIASGGELSRIMLAVKTILAKTASVETIIFDEVDAGIAGATADVVGEKLQSLANYHQIVCITHLPQIASKHAAHFLVTKEVKGKRTQTRVSELDRERRVSEIARLLGGKTVSRKAIARAREMLS
jgi:DNA repair protein RecN (Recombination protein N)